MSDEPVADNKKFRFRPGVSVKNGKLYAFSEARVIVAKGWPEMAAWTKTRSSPRWARFRPNIYFQEGVVDAVRSRHRFRVPSPFQPEENPCEVPSILPPFAPELADDGGNRKVQEKMDRDRNLVRDYFGDVPLEVQNAVAPFQSRQWHLYAMAARCPGALDLMVSNPALAYSLASCWAFGVCSSKDGIRTIRRLVNTPRRRICGFLGFPESEASVSVLSKIPVVACSIPWLLSLRKIMHHADWHKPLLHIHSLNPAIMLILSRKTLQNRLTQRLIQEFSRETADESISICRQLILMMILEKSLEGGGRRKKLDSSNQFCGYILDLIYQTQCEGRSVEPITDLPLPPIPGNGMIIPLETLELPFEEASEQENCVESYAREIAGGSVYLYRVLNPERATLSLKRGSSGWIIDQLLCARNRSVSNETREAVEQWMAETAIASVA